MTDDLDEDAARRDPLLRALGAEARAQGLEDNPALRPLSADETGALLDAVLGPAPSRAQPPASRSRAWAWGGVLAAAAAVLALVLVPREPAALPEYRLVAGGGEQALRSGEPGEATARVAYTTGSRVLLVARPAADAPSAVVPRVFLRQGGAVTPLDVPLAVSPAGAVQLDLVAGESLKLPPGDAELVLLLRPASLGSDDRTLLDAADPSPARALVHPFRYTPAP